MSVVAITGNHPRHVHLVKSLAAAGLLSGWVVETRKAFVPQPDDTVPAKLHDLFRLHFQRREEAEHRFFGELTPADVDCDQLAVTAQSLNDDPTRRFLADKAPRLVLSYGCHKLSPETLAATPARFLNNHGGLSPWYRGVHTHFWPSFLLEPQMTGVTLHETTEAIDGGAVFHQSGVALTRGDGLHDTACRAVAQYVSELPQALSAALARSDFTGETQKTSGRIWIASAWRPEHLIPIYEHHQDRIADLCLDGEIAGREPNLIRPLFEPA